MNLQQISLISHAIFVLLLVNSSSDFSVVKSEAATINLKLSGILALFYIICDCSLVTLTIHLVVTYN